MLKLWYREKYVLTTEQVAEILGTDPARIRQSFKRNKKHFIEGKHYFRLKGEELKTMKALLDGEQLNIKKIFSSMKLVEAPDSTDIEVPKPTMGKRSASMILWTRKGVARHAKVLTTEQAWAIYERMEEVYFSVMEKEVLEEPTQLTLNGRKVWTLKQASEMFNRSIKQIQKALYGRRFERGKDFFVTDLRQLEELSAENGQWFSKKLTLILESGLSKLRAKYEERLEAPLNETLEELRAGLEKVISTAVGMCTLLAVPSRA